MKCATVGGAQGAIGYRARPNADGLMALAVEDDE